MGDINWRLQQIDVTWCKHPREDGDNDIAKLMVACRCLFAVLGRIEKTSVLSHVELISALSSLDGIINHPRVHRAKREFEQLWKQQNT